MRSVKLHLHPHIITSNFHGNRLNPVSSSESNRTDKQRRRLTMRAYSTLMMGQSRMEGDTGGILSSFPSQLWLFPCGSGSPRRLETSCWICLPLPLAKKVWVWYSAALGTTTRDEQFSTSAKIWMDSPWREEKGSVRQTERESGMSEMWNAKRRGSRRNWGVGGVACVSGGALSHLVCSPFARSWR